MKLLDRWKILISGITLLPMAGTTLAQAGHTPLADANWQPNDKLQPPVFADTLKAGRALDTTIFKQREKRMR